MGWEAVAGVLAMLLCFCLGDELVYVLQLSRHGARYPRLPSATWNIHPMQLTPAGMRQHYLLGQALRRRYIDNLHFLSSQYNAKQLSVHSSNMTRCIASAEAQLAGLYPPGTGARLSASDPALGCPPNIQNYGPWQQSLHNATLNHSYQVVPVVSTSKAIMNWEYVCPGVGNAIQYPKDEKMLRERYRELYQLLAVPLNITTELTLSKATGIRDLLICGLYEGKYPVNETHSHQTIKDTSVLYHIRKYAQYLNMTQGDIKVSQAIATPFLRKMLTSIARAKEIHSEGRLEHKMDIFVGSDTLMQALMMQLGYGFDKYDCPFTTLILFELYLALPGSYYVRMIYNNDINVTYAYDAFLDTLRTQSLDNERYTHFCSMSRSGPSMSKNLYWLFIIAGLFVLLIIIAGLVIQCRRTPLRDDHVELKDFPTN